MSWSGSWPMAAINRCRMGVTASPVSSIQTWSNRFSRHCAGCLEHPRLLRHADREAFFSSAFGAHGLIDRIAEWDGDKAGSPEGTLFVLKRAFQSHQYVLADAAYKQTLRLRTISAGLDILDSLYGRPFS